MSSEKKHTPGPILNDGETPRGVMLLAGPEDRETVIYLQGPERQQYARLFAAAPNMHEYIAKRAAAGDSEARVILESINASR